MTESGESTISFLSDEIVRVEFLYEKSIYNWLHKMNIFFDKTSNIWFDPSFFE